MEVVDCKASGQLVLIRVIHVEKKLNFFPYAYTLRGIVSETIFGAANEEVELSWG